MKEKAPSSTVAPAERSLMTSLRKFWQRCVSGKFVQWTSDDGTRICVYLLRSCLTCHLKNTLCLKLSCPKNTDHAIKFPNSLKALYFSELKITIISGKKNRVKHLSFMVISSWWKKTWRPSVWDKGFGVPPLSYKMKQQKSKNPSVELPCLNCRILCFCKRYGYFMLLLQNNTKPKSLCKKLLWLYHHPQLTTPPHTNSMKTAMKITSSNREFQRGANGG